MEKLHPYSGHCLNAFFENNSTAALVHAEGYPCNNLRTQRAICQREINLVVIVLDGKTNIFCFVNVDANLKPGDHRVNHTNMYFLRNGSVRLFLQLMSDEWMPVS